MSDQDFNEILVHDDLTEIKNAFVELILVEEEGISDGLMVEDNLAWDGIYRNY